jgi:hypothetical protein
VSGWGAINVNLCKHQPRAERPHPPAAFVEE